MATLLLASAVAIVTMAANARGDIALVTAVSASKEDGNFVCARRSTVAVPRARSPRAHPPRPPAIPPAAPACRARDHDRKLASRRRRPAATPPLPGRGPRR